MGPLSYFYFDIFINKTRHFYLISFKSKKWYDIALYNSMLEFKEKNENCFNLYYSRKIPRFYMVMILLLRLSSAKNNRR